MLRYLLPLLLLLIAGCTSSNKLLLHTWRVNEVTFVDSLNTLTDLQKKNLSVDLKKNLQFTFYHDSAFQVRNANDVVNGKWWLSTDRKILFTQMQGQITPAKVYEIKKGLLRFESAGEYNQTFIFDCLPVTTDKK